MFYIQENDKPSIIEKLLCKIKIEGNKNQTQYKIKQEYISGNINSQEILEPVNIKGVAIKKENNKLTIENTELNLKSIMENYNYISNNNLDLASFIEDYKNDKKAYYEEKEEIILYTKLGAEKKLYIDKKTNLPTKMEVVDTNKNSKVYILYNEVEIN